MDYMKENNFIDNIIKQASFIRSHGNKWIKNYWSEWNKILPYPIRGTINLGNLSWICNCRILHKGPILASCILVYHPCYDIPNNNSRN